MAKYKFRLNSVEKVRAARRDQSRAALADAFRAEQVLAENRASIADEQIKLQELQREVSGAENPEVARLVDAQQYALVLRARQQELIHQDELLKIETERRRLALVEAEREVRVLELLDQRHRGEHERHERRLETKLLDEIGAGLQFRNRGGDQ